MQFIHWPAGHCEAMSRKAWSRRGCVGGSHSISARAPVRSALWPAGPRSLPPHRDCPSSTVWRSDAAGASHVRHWFEHNGERISATVGNGAAAGPPVISAIHCPAGHCGAMSREGAVTEAIGSPSGICDSRPGNMGASPTPLPVISTARTSMFVGETPHRGLSLSTSPSSMARSTLRQTRRLAPPCLRACYSPSPRTLMPVLSAARQGHAQHDPERGRAGAAARRCRGRAVARPASSGVGKASSSPGPASPALRASAGSPR